MAVTIHWIRAGQIGWLEGCISGDSAIGWTVWQFWRTSSASTWPFVPTEKRSPCLVDRERLAPWKMHSRLRRTFRWWGVMVGERTFLVGHIAASRLLHTPMKMSTALPGLRCIFNGPLEWESCRPPSYRWLDLWAPDAEWMRTPRVTWALQTQQASRSREVPNSSNNRYTMYCKIVIQSRRQVGE